jgi:high-affinity iron transporter
MTINVFAVPVFFVVFRETLEAAIIISVLLAFLKQTLHGPLQDPVVYKKLVRQVRALSDPQISYHLSYSLYTIRIYDHDALITDNPQVWFGSLSGFLICLIVGGGIIGAFYGLGRNAWASTEYYWEGAFCIFASLIITVLGAALLRVSKMEEKWRVKIAKALEGDVLTRGLKKSGAFRRWCEKYALFLVPFITVLREGIEAIVFIAGVSFSSPAASVPLPVVIGLIAGGVVGYIIYK